MYFGFFFLNISLFLLGLLVYDKLEMKMRQGWGLWKCSTRPEPELLVYLGSCIPNLSGITVVMLLGICAESAPTANCGQTMPKSWFVELCHLEQL